MGVTLHYKGTTDPNRIADLVAEVEDIAHDLGWPHTILDDGEVVESSAEPARDGDSASGYRIEETLPLTGIMLTPAEGCESFQLLFDPDGMLWDLVTYHAAGQGEVWPGNEWVHVKTQFAEIAAHVTLVELLRHLKRTHLTSLEVDDEGGFWETGDLAQLESRRQIIATWMDRLEVELTFPEEGAEGDALDAQAVADRIERAAQIIWDREQRQP